MSGMDEMLRFRHVVIIIQSYRCLKCQTNIHHHFITLPNQTSTTPYQPYPFPNPPNAHAALASTPSGTTPTLSLANKSTNNGLGLPSFASPNPV